MWRVIFGGQARHAVQPEWRAALLLTLGPGARPRNIAVAYRLDGHFGQCAIRRRTQLSGNLLLKVFVPRPNGWADDRRRDCWHYASELSVQKNPTSTSEGHAEPDSSLEIASSTVCGALACASIWAFCASIVAVAVPRLASAAPRSCCACSARLLASQSLNDLPKALKNASRIGARTVRSAALMRLRRQPRPG